MLLRVDPFLNASQDKKKGILYKKKNPIIRWSIPVVERIGASVVVRNDPSDMIVPPAAVTTMPMAQKPIKAVISLRKTRKNKRCLRLNISLNEFVLAFFGVQTSEYSTVVRGCTRLPENY